MIRIENVTAGMKIIPAGRTKAVEVLMIDNHRNANVYQVGHMGSGFAVTNIPAGATVRLAA